MADYYYNCSAVKVNGNTLSSWTTTPPITVNGNRCYRLKIGSTDVIHKYEVGTKSYYYTITSILYLDFTVSNFTWTYDACSGGVDGTQAYYSFKVYSESYISYDEGGEMSVTGNSYKYSSGSFTFNACNSTNPDSTSGISGNFWSNQNGTSGNIIVTKTPAVTSTVTVYNEYSGNYTTHTVNNSSRSGTILTVAAGNSSTTKLGLSSDWTNDYYNKQYTTQIY